jgi:AAA family ATP:ADP antiporter
MPNRVRESVWRQLISRLGVDLRPGEGASAVLLFLYFFLIITFQYATKSLRQAEYIDRLGAQALPLVYLLVAVCSLPVLILYSRSVDKVPRQHLMATTLLLVAGSLVGFYFLFQLDAPWVPVLFYVWISIVYVLNVSQFWSYSNHVFDPRQAKRLFGFVGAGGLLGGIAGGQVAAWTTKLVGTYAALFVAAAILVVAGALIHLIHWLHRGDERAPAGSAGLSKLEEARGGFRTILHSRHLQLVAAIMLLTVVVAQIVDVQFSEAVQRSTTTLGERTTFFGNFYSAMGIASLIFQLVFTSRIHSLLGIGFATRVLPVSMMGGTIILLVAAGFAPALLLPAALSLKASEGGIRYSLDQATRELLFLPVPSRARLKAKATIDIFVQRLGKGAAAVLLLPVLFGWVTPIEAGWLTLGLIVLWLGVTVAMRRQYVRSFRDRLKAEGVDVASPIDLSDATGLELLVQALDSEDPRQVVNSMELLESNDKGHLVPRLMLYHSDPTVRCRAMQVFARCGRTDAAPMVDRLLGDEIVDVRVEAMRTLVALKGGDTVALMLQRLDDADPRIRAAAISALAGRTTEAAGDALEILVVDDRSEARIEAAGILGSIRGSLFEGSLIRLVYDTDHRVARRAIRSARSRIERGELGLAYAPMLIASLRNRRLKHDARDALVAWGAAVIPALVHFLNDPEENIWVRRAIPKTLSRIESHETARALSESLTVDDALLRRTVIEALSPMSHDGDPVVQQAMRERLGEEVRGYLRHLGDLLGLDLDDDARFQGPRVVWSDRPPTFLHHLLSDRMHAQLEDTFALLGLLHPTADIRAAQRGLVGTDPASRSHALEYLDNTLSGELRSTVFAAIGDLGHARQFVRARQLFDIEVESRSATLRRLMTTRAPARGQRAWLAAAAVHAVYTLREADLYPLVRDLGTTADEPLVRETAQWVSRRPPVAG